MSYAEQIRNLNLAQPKAQPSLNKEESAGELVARMADEIQSWLDHMTKTGEANGKRFVLSASLSHGTSIVVHRLGARCHTMIWLEGELPDGNRTLLVAHQNAIQLLTYFVIAKPEEPKREIGFHVGIDPMKTVKQ